MKKTLLLEIAKNSIKSHFGKTMLETKTLSKDNPQLLEQGAVFVTLTLDGELRGCIGSIIAHRSLLDDLIHNAKAAAFEDPRFPPLSEEEFSKIDIELSLLSMPKEIPYKDIEDLKSKISVNVDGVVLRDGNYQSTFLPQVWEQLPSFDLFFAHLCQKAGLGTDCLLNHPQIFTYQVEKISKGDCDES